MLHVRALRLSLSLALGFSCAAMSIAAPATKEPMPPSPESIGTKPGVAAKPATRPTTNPTIPFEKEIAAFEAADRKTKPTPGGVLFYGSSSIRLWKSLDEDLPGMPCVNRGFGGSTIPDALRFAERVLVPHAPSTIVFYSGDNDLQKGRTAQQVIGDTREFVAKVRKILPQTRVVLVAVKPSPSRLRLLGVQREVNKAVAEWVKQENDPNLCHVDVFSAMLGTDGTPRADLFGPDKLHMNRTGYKLWTGLIQPILTSQAVSASAKLKAAIKPATPQPVAREGASSPQGR